MEDQININDNVYVIDYIGEIPIVRQGIVTSVEYIDSHLISCTVLCDGDNRHTAVKWQDVAAEWVDLKPRYKEMLLYAKELLANQLAAVEGRLGALEYKTPCGKAKSVV